MEALQYIAAVDMVHPSAWILPNGIGKCPILALVQKGKPNTAASCLQEALFSAEHICLSTEPGSKEGCVEHLLGILGRICPAQGMFILVTAGKASQHFLGSTEAECMRLLISQYRGSGKQGICNHARGYNRGSKGRQRHPTGFPGKIISPCGFPSGTAEALKFCKAPPYPLLPQSTAFRKSNACNNISFQR